MEKKMDGKIILPKETQIKMMNFFLKTSIPRKKSETIKFLSNKKRLGENYDETTK